MLFRFLILVHVCAAFPFKCPEPAQWSTRARGRCPDPSKYFCLKNDLINGYSENCTIFDFLQPGRKTVLRGGLDADICSAERYQPWPITFYTNVSTNCIFLKSTCNGEGQVIYGNGNRNTDITCRCDYTKGYDFIVKPQNPCWCVPSEEDCSCYLKMCKDSRHVLSRDYACIHSQTTFSINQCEPMVIERKNINKKQNDTEYIEMENTSDLEECRTKVAFIVTSILTLLLFLSFPFTIVFNKIKTIISRCFKEYMNLSVDVSSPEEGDDITITGKVVYKNLLLSDVPWYKDGQPVKIAERLISKKENRKFSLTIKNCNIYDSGNYSIDVHGKKRSCHLEIRENYNIPLEIQKMNKVDKDRYIKILKEGSEKRHNIKIMILGRHGVGKSSLMRRLLQEPIDGVSPTDGIDIVTKCKVDIMSGEWIYNEADTTDERIGRAIRKTDKSDSSDQKNNTQEQIRQSKATDKNIDQVSLIKYDTDNTDTTAAVIEIKRSKEQLQENETHHEAGEHVRFDSSKTSGGRKNDEIIMPEHSIEKIKKRNDNKVSTKSFDGNIDEQRNTVLGETQNIDTVLEMGCKAKVPHREYADCIILDFAGHNEYYSTHQTFLTKNAIYLVVFSLNDNNTFREDVDETEKLSFWIDNIHCYASEKRQIGQTKGGINPPIIMVCTNDDTDDGQMNSYGKREEWKEKFAKLLRINQRFSHIIGEINYISNKVKSEDAFNSLRTLIYDVAKNNKSEWGKHYPVRWIQLEKALNKLRNEGKYVLEFNFVLEEAKKDPLSITSEKEVILFLKFQHEIGNLIFYNERVLRNFVITEPTWLINAFKCIICANEFKKFSRRTHHEELQKFEDTGVISSDLCRKLFKAKSNEHANKSDFVLSVMEKFDIIVKDPSDKSSFICPCGIKFMKKSSNYDTVFNENNISKETCYRSPWLYIEFIFLPPALYNHLLVLCMNDFTFEKPKLYHEVGIFCIKESKGRDKIVLRKSNKTIMIQRVQSGFKSTGLMNETIINGHNLYKNISSKIHEILRKHDITLEYELSIACGNAPDDSVDDRYSVNDIKSKLTKWCNYHSSEHNIEDMYRFWVEKIDLLVKMPETIKNMSVYDREAFLKAANSGTTKRYNIRVMIVGKQSAGKTCLLRRLMNEEIDDVTSTDGINIERRKCHIDIKTGEWHFSSSDKKLQDFSTDQREEFADCGFWDFAGKKEFYATHQTFLSANAVYLLVVDISEDFKSKTYENMIEKEFDTIGEYIDFWLDNIHCYCTDDKKTPTQGNKDRILNPPVIIVGTGIDKVPSNDREDRKQKFLTYLSDTMSTQPKRRHLRKPHFLSNKFPSNTRQEFEELRKDIFCKAKDLSNWEENLPVRWVVLEKEICSIKVKKDILHAEAFENKKVMLYAEAQSLADECSFPNVKQETSELDSFLKYEHEIGNIVFFKEVKESIVLDPEWLVDVFRCFVSHEYNDDTLGMTEWDVLAKTGKLEDTLIETLLQKVPCLILRKHKNYLLELMEEFSIIVKPKASINDIYMPCMIKPRPFREILGKVDVETEYCKKSSWFCLVFNFLPPSYFNHILVSFVKNNPLFYDKKDSRLGIYRNVGIFQLNNTGSKILVMCLSKNLIAMKVVQFNSTEDVCYSYIKTQLINLVESINLRYRINVNYEIRFKCQGGSLYGNEGIGYDEAMEKSEYRCTDHNEMHSSRSIYKYWLKEEEVADELKKKGRRRCIYCKNMCVYMCYDCNKALCKDCSRKHENENMYISHAMQPISDTFILNCKWQMMEQYVGDIECLPNGEIIVATYSWLNQQILVFSVSGKQRAALQLESRPCQIVVVDKTNVAVYLRTKDLAIVDILQNHVQYIRYNAYAQPYSSDTLIYIENEFYISDQYGIVVIDMSGSVKRRITLSFTPCDICYDVDSQHIYCIVRDKRQLICIDRDGNDIFTFTNPSMTNLNDLTIDNEGNVLLLCEQDDWSGYVIKVDSNGEKSEVVITNIDLSRGKNMKSCICFHHLTNSVVIGAYKEVYIYKKI